MSPPLPRFDYTRAQAIDALRAAGVREGDILLVHASVGRLGRVEGCSTMAETCHLLFAALREAVGPAGTLVVPTYTYSCGKRQVFDVAQTPSAIGEFTELFRQQPGAVRSADPMLSVSAQGPRAGDLLRDLPQDCYGPGSVYGRLHDAGARLCLLGLELHWATYRHYIEQCAAVPFRFLKLFNAVIREHGRDRAEAWTYFAAPFTTNCHADANNLGQLARQRGLCGEALLGRARLLTIGAQEYRAFAIEELRRDPWLTAKGPSLSLPEIVAREDVRVGAAPIAVSLPPEAGLREILATLGPLRRDLVSDGFDAALHALAGCLPMTIHEYPSGRECFTWIVPEKWTCHEARLETLEGRRLLDTADHPLHVVSYSLPFEGVVSREELFRHLHTHPSLPDAAPFVFKYYERDWGLCCAQTFKDQLTEDTYRVVIRTDTSFGTLKVGEVFLPGEVEDCIVLCAHLCHPGQVADDLSGVAVGVEVMRRLQARGNLRYTYRLLILPETIGSVAWLSAHEHLLPQVKGGLFLEMLSLPNAPALQMSFHGHTEVDQCFALALSEHDPAGWTAPFRTLVGNDERQFNAPGIRVPMLSLSRVQKPGTHGYPFPEYHSTRDNLDAVSWPHLEESVSLTLRLIETLEGNCTPRNLFKGEVFCTRYGIHQDHYENPQAHRALFDVLSLIDGEHSLAEIALRTGHPFSAVREIVDKLATQSLVSTSN